MIKLLSKLGFFAIILVMLVSAPTALASNDGAQHYLCGGDPLEAIAEGLAALRRINAGETNFMGMVLVVDYGQCVTVGDMDDASGQRCCAQCLGEQGKQQSQREKKAACGPLAAAKLH